MSIYQVTTYEEMLAVFEETGELVSSDVIDRIGHRHSCPFVIGDYLLYGHWNDPKRGNTATSLVKGAVYKVIRVINSMGVALRIVTSLCEEDQKVAKNYDGSFIYWTRFTKIKNGDNKK